MIPFDSGSNYYEIYINQGKGYEVGLSPETFRELLSCLARSNTEYKFFQKEYKEYTYGDIIVHNYKNTETRVFKHTPVTIQELDNKMLLGYHRSKLTFLSVPSTKNIHDMKYIKKLIFRVNNRIFINFQIALDVDGKKVYTVYVNYNHESNIDPEETEKLLNDIMSIIS